MGKKGKLGKLGKAGSKPVRRRTPTVRDRHLLYTAAVQSVDADADFFQRVYRRARGERFLTLREDFCGTAALACEWVRRNRAHRAWGIDLDAATLDWGRERYVPALGEAASRLSLVEGDVLTAKTPRVDVIAALNFSYSVFKTRYSLGAYFRRVRASLRPQGLFFVDAYGGTESMIEEIEERKIDACDAFDGTRVPRFTYIWEQASFNPVDHHTVCHIHFKLRDGKKLRKAFSYDWRLWTLPELRELMLEAGFERADVYVEGWDDDADDTDGVFRRRAGFENMAGWVAYVVGTL